jgi:hypothetical protein
MYSVYCLPDIPNSVLHAVGFKARYLLAETFLQTVVQVMLETPLCNDEMNFGENPLGLVVA